MPSDEAKPCEFCNGDGCKVDGYDKDWGEGVTIELTGLGDGEPRIDAEWSADGGYYHGVKSFAVKFCPICGRRLV